MLRIVAVSLLLMLAVAIVYRPALSYGFVNLDDPDNVSTNKPVLDGLSPEGVYWAFTTDHADYWRPVTWLSFMLDSSLYRSNEPRGYHLTNIALHALNAALLLVVLSNLTGLFWRSAAVAALFALHPLRVESVAWITERKDMLSMLFFLLTVFTYAKYARAARGDGWPWHIVALVFLGLGLMSKPMLVTTPFVLLLLDFWPLDRLPREAGIAKLIRPIARLVIEKIPMFLLCLGSAAITSIHGAKSVAGIPWRHRLPNVIVSYARYALDTFWPGDMAVYYPYPGMFGAPPWAWWQVAAAAIGLVAMTILAWRMRATRPWILVGWLLFLGMLVPVIGLLQVGLQGMADRFSYIPAVGLLVIIVWAAAELATKQAKLRLPLIAALFAALALFTWSTSRHIPVWRDTDSLYRHAIAVTDHNWKIHDYYADYLFHQKRQAESLDQLREALKLNPDEARIHNRMGYLLVQSNDLFEAREHLERAVALDPNSADAWFNLGCVQMRRNDLISARRSLEKAMNLDPAKAEGYRPTLDQIKARQRSD